MSNDTNTTQQAILDFARSLEWRKRDDGTEYCALADNATDWMLQLVQTCHAGHLPDDGTYKMICQVAVELADMVTDGIDLADELSAQIDGLCPIANADLIRWELDCALADESIAEALANGLVDGQSKDFSIHALRAAGWVLAAERIAQQIIGAAETTCE